MKKVLRESKDKVEGSVEMKSDELIGLFEQFDAGRFFMSPSAQCWMNTVRD